MPTFHANCTKTTECCWCIFIAAAGQVVSPHLHAYAARVIVVGLCVCEVCPSVNCFFLETEAVLRWNMDIVVGLSYARYV